MPRSSSHTPDSIAAAALKRFWFHGFHATSMDDLVRSTTASRHAIYSAFGGKRDLFLACLHHYVEEVVTPAFGIVENDHANLATIARFFDIQIARAEQSGLPGPGCLLANSATEVAPTDPQVAAIVADHNARLAAGFARALRNSSSPGALPDSDRFAAIAHSLVVFANGLWSTSRVCSSADRLRGSAETFLDLIAKELD